MTTYGSLHRRPPPGIEVRDANGNKLGFVSRSTSAAGYVLLIICLFLQFSLCALKLGSMDIQQAPMLMIVWESAFLKALVHPTLVL